jgi:hypothetical protein
MTVQPPLGSRIRSYRNSARRTIVVHVVGDGAGEVGTEIAQRGFANVDVIRHRDGLDLARLGTRGGGAGANAVVIVYRDGDGVPITAGDPALEVPVTSVLIQPDHGTPASANAAQLRVLADLFVTTPNGDYVHELIDNLAS